MSTAVLGMMFPYTLSTSFDSVRVSSNPLPLCTSTLYLTVAQALVVVTNPLVIVAELGASSDLTVTVLDEVGPKCAVLTRSEWPFTVTASVTVASSPWTAVKSHVALPPFGISAGGQVVLAMALPGLPAGHAANPVAVKTSPYALSQIWSTMTPPSLAGVVLVMATW